MHKADYLSIKSIFNSISSFNSWHALRTHGLAQLGWLESRKSRRSIDAFGPVPWWTYSCTHYLDQMISTDSSVIEFGGGASTLWWLNRGNKVLTVETDPKWSENITAQVELNPKKDNWELITVSEISRSNLAPLINSRQFDVVINDGLGDRTEIIELLKSLRNERGFLIWDNSDRIEYKEGLEALAEIGLARLDFFGLSPINAYCSQTTIFNSEFPQPIHRSVEFNTIAN